MSADPRIEIHENVRIMDAVVQHGQTTSVEIWNLYRARYGDTFTRHDPRSYTLARISRQAQFATVLQEMTRDVLLDPRWWQRYHELGKATVTQTISDAMSLSWQVFYTGSYTAFEHGIRALVRAFDPGACNGASQSFRSVTGWLFKRLRQDGWNYSEADEFMTLYALYRNTMHNNGWFFPERGGDREIIWRCNRYRFVVGKPVPNALEIHENAKLVRELIDLAASIMRVPMVLAMPPIAPDPTLPTF